MIKTQVIQMCILATAFILVNLFQYNWNYLLSTIFKRNDNTCCHLYAKTQAVKSLDSSVRLYRVSVCLHSYDVIDHI